MKIIISTLLFTLLISCDFGSKEIIKKYEGGTLTIKDSLVPEKSEAYTTKLIKLKGYTDDSIYVNFGGGSFNKYYKGNFDILLNPDYYGGVNANFEFNSYKAKKGDLEITFKIQ